MKKFNKNSMEPDPDEILHPGLESLDWSKELEEKAKAKRPSARYTKFSEHARSMISGEKQCALFCGGKKCKYCRSENWTPDQMHIDGLYSNWVTDNILAMARPSTKQIKEHNIIQQFKKNDIKSVLNLQKAGEHADCGEGLEKAGFSYDPQLFMDNGIFFYNFGWPDYGVAALSTILDMVKVIQFGVSEGKVAVHCHAGLGRTGVIIACYLVYTNRMSGSEAIHYVRVRRKGAIQTRGQMQCVQEFEQYLKPFRVVFASRSPGSHEFTLMQYLNRQRHMLHGYEGRKLKHVPKVIYVVCEKLLQLANLGQSLSKFGSSRRTTQGSMISMQSEDSKTEQSKRSGSDVSIKASVQNGKDSSQIAKREDMPRVDSKKSLQSLTSSKPPLLKHGSISMEDLSDENLKTVLKVGKNNDSDSNSSREPSFTSRQNSEIAETSSTDELLSCTNVVLSVKEVVDALGTSEISEEQFNLAENLETKLNESEDAWHDLVLENDPVVLAQVMWDWLDHLKVPALRAQDLNLISQFSDDPDTGLQKLEKGTRYTLEYLIKVIGKLKPMDKLTENNVMEKLLSYMTHQWVTLSDSSTAGSMDSWSMSTRNSDSVDEDHHWGTMKYGMSAKLHAFVRNIQQSLAKDVKS
ncbi:protein tyrosine phosphatase domain-containing protein 1-like [Saccostrea echinata]|uniref:protein tyrosine phosphatase domain-containing protein 1-like n=1 Tax=Saccostrea echinata TaxID=191078 RepID=UPI002A841136|nr:protein tyrosine phosphatase domain-containing protein 1-like [Saccostrea echinata]